jgi:hypothetical protein
VGWLACLIVLAVTPLCYGQTADIALPIQSPSPPLPASAPLLETPLAQAPLPQPVLPQPTFAQAASELAPAPDAGDRIVLEMLPFGVLWEPPIANLREPRCYAIFNSQHGEGAIDTAIGADFSLGRIGPAAHKDEGFEIDVFAAVFSRFELRQKLAALDYRVGCPLTFAKNDWQFKLSYEHTSTHTGDDQLTYMIDEGMYSGAVAPARKFMRDELVFGVARRFGERIRVYGQIGCSFSDNAELTNDVWRYDWGVEWTPPRNSQYQSGPYAAFDMDLRDEQDYVPNVTIEAGWEWRVRRGRDSAGRLGAIYYNGKSLYGVYLQDHESWLGFIASYDW